MANFQIAGDVQLTVDDRRFVRVAGIERIRSRLNALLQIAVGSYEYSQIGVRYLEAIGHPINKGRLCQILRDAAMSDPEVLDVSDQTVDYKGNRAHKASLVVHTKHGAETVIL